MSADTYRKIKCFYILTEVSTTGDIQCNSAMTPKTAIPIGIPYIKPDNFLVHGQQCWASNGLLTIL